MGNNTIAKQSVSTASVENRAAPRRKVLLTSKLIYDNGDVVLDCAIRDISATGARITLAQKRSIPEDVFLLDLPNRMAYHATVVSERASGFGLKFLETYKLAQITSPELRFLKRVWIAAAQ